MVDIGRYQDGWGECKGVAIFQVAEDYSQTNQTLQVPEIIHLTSDDQHIQVRIILSITN